jgi:hypothetical protein
MQVNIMKSAMQSGLILGLIFSGNFLLSVSNINALMALTYVVAAFIVYYIYKTAIKFRDTECDGVISYGKSFLFIILLFFYAALISTAIKYVYLRYINTTYLETIFQESMKLIQSMKLPMKAADLEQTENMFKPLNFSLLYIWSNVILGTFVALIMSAFIKKDKNIFEN